MFRGRVLALGKGTPFLPESEKAEIDIALGKPAG
jgi:hypothetical protein